MEHSYTIECSHLYLKPMDEKSVEIYRQLRNMDENRKWFFHDEKISIEQQQRWYARYLQEDGDYMFGIYEKESQTYIGGIGIYEVDMSALTAEVGRILVDRAFSGNGYGAEAISSIAQFARKQLGLHQLYAHILYNNAASRKSFEISGFKRCEKQENTEIVKMVLYLKA